MARGLWLGLRFPCLPVEVFARGQAQEQPVVVLERRRVAWMNAAAREAGVLLGSSMGGALAVCGQLAGRERDAGKEAAALRQLARWCYQFTPKVAVRAPLSLLLDIAGSLRLFGGLERLRARIGQGLGELGFSAQDGVNGTPLSALCYAKAGMGVNLGEVPGSLRRLPVRHLELEAAVIDSLGQMGIHYAGQLLDLPCAGLQRRFGAGFTGYLQRLLGEQADPQEFITEKPHFRSELAFVTEVTSLAALALPVQRLLGELQGFLRARQLLVGDFRLTLGHRQHPDKRIEVRLARPDNDAEMFLALCQLQLDKVRDMPAVDSVCLTARRFLPVEAGSGALFGKALPERYAPAAGAGAAEGGDNQGVAEAQARLLNVLHARLGEGACFGIALANDHRPELAWQRVPLSGRSTSKAPAADQALLERNPRPLLLLPEPRRLEVRSGGPWFNGPLEILQGPERIDAGWWGGSQTAAARDYYIARQAGGSTYWLFREGDGGSWHLHGVFA